MKRSVRLFAFGVLGAGWVLAVAHSASAPENDVTRTALLEAFPDAMRDVVLKWSAADPRPVRERQLALFDFVYQTYESSAWIPQSLFDRNLITQAIVGDL